MTRTALYPGTFDPFTNGHLDILSAALALSDVLVVAIGVHATKSTLFDPAEREAMITEAIAGLPDGAAERIRVITFDGLTVDAARQFDATLIVRGLRNGGDFDYEMQMAATNAVLAPDIKTVFVPASPTSRHITATLVRQIARMGGDLSTFVPPSVAARLREKVGGSGR
jgi:pantetheine-phosphate adenylyltransferase